MEEADVTLYAKQCPAGDLSQVSQSKCKISDSEAEIECSLQDKDQVLLSTDGLPVVWRKHIMNLKTHYLSFGLKKERNKASRNKSKEHF